MDPGEVGRMLWFLAAVTVVILFITPLPCCSDEGSPITSLTSLNDEQHLMEFIQSPNVRVVYFWKKDRKVFQKFFVEYGKAASHLAKYNIEFGVVNCKTENIKTFCNRPDIYMKIVAFRDGQELLELNLENMFDVNSIMSNVLQIALLREVPILQILEERTDLEDKHRGRTDVIFSYQRAIGTYEHKVLMEIAFAFNQQYKFAITTDVEPVKDLPDYSEDEYASVWILRCQTAEDACSYRKYHDSVYGMNVAGLTRFIKFQEEKHVMSISEEKHNPFLSLQLTVAYIYHEPAGLEEAEDLAEKLNDIFQGMLAVVLVDVKLPVAPYHGYTSSLTLPALGVLRKNTEDPEFLTHALTVESAKKFIIKALHSYAGQEEIDMDEEDIDEGDLVKFLDVEKQDDQVAELAALLNVEDPLNLAHVLVLKDTTFVEETTERDLLLVLFYLPFDSVSQVFVRAYEEAAESLSQDGHNVLAVMNCYDWTDVCSKNNITSYPVIRIYKKGHSFVPYQGMLDAGAVTATVKLLVAGSPMPLKDEGELQSFLAGDMPPSVNQYTEVAVVGLFNSDHKQELQSFQLCAEELQGQFLLGHAAVENLESFLLQHEITAPAVLLHKRHDLMEPYVILPATTDHLKLQETIKSAALPNFPELTVYNFADLFRQQKPFVILFDTDIVRGKKGHKMIMKILPTGAFKDFSFVWMDLAHHDSIASRVLWEYDPHADIPTLVVVDHSKGHIYNFPPGDMTVDRITSWLNQVQEESITPSKMLPKGDWKPRNPGYDFLKMMDEEEAKEELMKEKEEAKVHISSEERGRLRHSGRLPHTSVDASTSVPDEVVADHHVHTEL